MTFQRRSFIYRLKKILKKTTQPSLQHKFADTGSKVILEISCTMISK